MASSPAKRWTTLYGSVVALSASGDGVAAEGVAAVTDGAFVAVAAGMRTSGSDGGLEPTNATAATIASSRTTRTRIGTSLALRRPAPPTITSLGFPLRRASPP